MKWSNLTLEGRWMYQERLTLIENFYKYGRPRLLELGFDKKRFIKYWIFDDHLMTLQKDFWVDINLAYNQPRFGFNKDNMLVLTTEAGLHNI